MSRRSRRRSRSYSRDSWRRSYGRSTYSSYSRSRTPSRSRRGASRDRKSTSGSRVRSSEHKITSNFARDRKRNTDSRTSVATRNTQWKQTPESRPHVKSHNHYSGFRGKRGMAGPGTFRGSNKYESEEFKSQRLQKLEAYNQHKNAFKLEKQKQKKELAELTTQLNNLVAQLALLPKEAPERTDIGQQIQDLKVSMKQLQTSRLSKPNQIDNRETKLLFKQLPECAKGPGKLAEWIASNSAVLHPKQIAMLASTAEGAVIQYHSHKTAEAVMSSCKLHGITVCWPPAPTVSDVPEAVDTSDDVDYNLL